VNYETLRIVKQLTRHLEVAECSENEWQNAILQGFAVWRQFRFHRRGVLVGDLVKRTINFELAPQGKTSTRPPAAPRQKAKISGGVAVRRRGK